MSPELMEEVYIEVTESHQRGREPQDQACFIATPGSRLSHILTVTQGKLLILAKVGFFTYNIMSIVPSCWVVLKIKGKVFGESDPVPGTKWPYSSLPSAYWKHTQKQT
jgi:hypothetical protein